MDLEHWKSQEKSTGRGIRQNYVGSYYFLYNNVNDVYELVSKLYVQHGNKIET